MTGAWSRRKVGTGLVLTALLALLIDGDPRRALLRCVGFGAAAGQPSTPEEMENDGPADPESEPDSGTEAGADAACRALLAAREAPRRLFAPARGSRPVSPPRRAVRARFVPPIPGGFPLRC